MKSYLVGGAVRDTLLGLPVQERDWVVVGATPQQMIDLGYKPVGKDFPVIEGYSQEDVTITASVQLLSGLRLVTDMMGEQRNDLEYAFNAKLDLGGLAPSIRVSEKGRLDFAGGLSSPR